MEKVYQPQELQTGGYREYTSHTSSVPGVIGDQFFIIFGLCFLGLDFRNLWSLFSRVLDFSEILVSVFRGLNFSEFLVSIFRVHDFSDFWSRFFGFMIFRVDFRRVRNFSRFFGIFKIC